MLKYWPCRNPNKDPTIPGYYIQRKDLEDAENRGGGLLFYIKNDVRFQPVNKMERFGLETLTIRVQLKRRDWVKITNCYLPSSSTQETRFDPSLLPSGPDSIIVGDLNGHSHIWDSAHGGESDTRGQEIEDWLLDQDLTTLNDGSSTLTRKRDGKKCCPDLTVVGSRWATVGLV